jgi:hypothetical protein
MSLAQILRIKRAKVTIYYLILIPNYSQQDETFLNVSGGFSAHHQEHITVRIASGTVNQYCC